MNDQDQVVETLSDLAALMSAIDTGSAERQRAIRDCIADIAEANEKLAALVAGWR